MKCCKTMLRATGKKLLPSERKIRRWPLQHRNTNRMFTLWTRIWELPERNLQWLRSFFVYSFALTFLGVFLFCFLQSSKLVCRVKQRVYARREICWSWLSPGSARRRKLSWANNRVRICSWQNSKQFRCAEFNSDFLKQLTTLLRIMNECYFRPLLNVLNQKHVSV